MEEEEEEEAIPKWDNMAAGEGRKEKQDTFILEGSVVAVHCGCDLSYLVF